MTTRSNRIVSAIVFAMLWTAGMMLRAAAIDWQTVVIAVIVGAVTGLLWFWLFDQINTLFRR